MILTVDARMISYSGIGTYLQNILPFVVKEFDTILLGDKKEIDSYSIKSTSSLKIIEVKSRVYSIYEHIELPIKIKKTNVYWSPHYVLPIPKLRSKAIVTTIHDINHLIFNRGIKRYYAKFMLKNVIKKSSTIITVSEFSKSEILKHTGVKAENVQVIYNGINKELFSNSYTNSHEINNLKKKFKLPEKFILYVGNVKPHKNLKRAIMAFKILLKKQNDLYFVIVGKAEGFITGDKEVMRTIDNDSLLKNRIIFTGNVDNKFLPFFYKAALILLFPSLYEGFGLPPLEAMACGTPVVASKVSSIPEVCGDAAYYINPYSEKDIAEGCIKIMTNAGIRNRFIERGFRRIEFFSWQKAAKKHIDLFKSFEEKL